MPRKERLSFREEKARGKPLVREMFGHDKKGEVELATLIVHPGAEFYKIGEKWTFFRLTERGREIMRIARSQARGTSKQIELELILEKTLDQLFYGGAIGIEDLAFSKRVYNTLRRETGHKRKIEYLRPFLLQKEGFPPLLWVGSFPFWTRVEIESFRNFGEKSMNEVLSTLEERKILLPTERIF